MIIQNRSKRFFNISQLPPKSPGGDKKRTFNNKTTTDQQATCVFYAKAQVQRVKKNGFSRIEFINLIPPAELSAPVFTFYLTRPEVYGGVEKREDSKINA